MSRAATASHTDTQSRPGTVARPVTVSPDQKKAQADAEKLAAVLDAAASPARRASTAMLAVKEQPALPPAYQTIDGIVCTWSDNAAVPEEEVTDDQIAAYAANCRAELVESDEFQAEMKDLWTVVDEIKDKEGCISKEGNCSALPLLSVGLNAAL